MSECCRDLDIFFREHCRKLCLTAFLLVLSLYNYLFSDNYRMDTIIKQASRGDEFNDMELGRFGIVLLNRFFGMRIHNPYLSAFLTASMILAASFFLCFMVWKAAEGRSGAFGCFLPLVMFLTPNWIEQLYFSYQSFLVVLGVVLVELAVLSAEYSRTKRGLIFPILLCFAAFAIYQAFTSLYLSLCVGLVLLRCVHGAAWKTVRPEKSALRHAAVFLSGIICYFVVNAILQRGSEGTGYLSTQVRWGTEPIFGVLRMLILSMQAIFTAGGEIDTISYTVSVVSCIIILAVSLPQFRDKFMRIILVLGWLLLQLAAFSLIFVLGGRGYIRTELSFPCVTAINFLFAFLLVKENPEQEKLPVRLQVWAVTAACAVSLYIAAGICFRLIYTDDVRYAFDYRLANQVISRLQKTGAVHGDKAVVFVGEPEITLDESCIMGEVIGRSLFQFQNDNDITNTLIGHLFYTQGFSYPEPGPEQLYEASLISEDMKNFPEEGSVLETDNIVVVKFSKDYYSKLSKLRPGWNPSDETVELREGTLCQLEKIATDGQKVRFMGFHLKRGTDSRELVNTVYLLNHNNGKLYSASTACRQRILLTRMYWRDGIQYDASGFMAEVPMSLFKQFPDSNFEILVRCEENGETYFVTTGQFINMKAIDRIPIGITEEWYKKK